MKQHKCRLCGETEPAKFYPKVRGLCWECQKSKYRCYLTRGRAGEDGFLCRCGETDWRNFYPGRKTKCKVCIRKDEKAARNP